MFTLGLGHRNAPSTLSSGIGSRLVYLFFSANKVQLIARISFEILPYRRKDERHVQSSFLNANRCDTPELDWSGASEDEEGGLRSSPRIYDNAFNSSSSRIFDKAFSASNVVDLRLETERLTSMVSFLIFQSEQTNSLMNRWVFQKSGRSSFLARFNSIMRHNIIEIKATDLSPPQKKN